MYHKELKSNNNKRERGMIKDGGLGERKPQACSLTFYLSKA